MGDRVSVTDLIAADPSARLFPDDRNRLDPEGLDWNTNSEAATVARTTIDIFARTLGRPRREREDSSVLGLLELGKRVRRSDIREPFQFIPVEREHSWLL